ncbi:MAG TPA: class II fructose-bisphosphate aldolase [Acidimicrobiales bacterium]
MPLTATASIVDAAVRHHDTVVAMNVIQIEHGEGLVAAATRAGRALVMQISENCVRYHGGLEPIALACLALARSAAVPVAVHLDHAVSADLVDEAVEVGLRSVMFDASGLDYDDNVAATGDVARRCHARGVWVEAELGEVGGKDGVHAAGARTDPDEAARFVATTGVDGLAVAVGSSHAMPTRETSLDLDLIGRLRDAVDVPLVLHGSSGVPDDELVRATGAGVVKINIATHLNATFSGAVRAALDAEPALTDSRRYLGPGRDALAAEAARLLHVLGAVPAGHVGAGSGSGSGSGR